MVCVKDLYVKLYISTLYIFNINTSKINAAYVSSHILTSTLVVILSCCKTVPSPRCPTSHGNPEDRATQWTVRISLDIFLWNVPAMTTSHSVFLKPTEKLLYLLVVV
jgi:peptidoglycan/LPS O-acetylase OafA/YrhL